MWKRFLFSNTEKPTEKAFSQSLLISVISILLCLVALCSMTYAWFTSSTSSNSNTLVSGSFSLERPSVIKLSSSAGEASALDASSVVNVTPVSGENGVYTCTLPANGTYQITLSCGQSTAKGRCIVTINGKGKSTDVIIGSEYKTANLGTTYTQNDPFTFRITTSAKDVTVTFQSVWGVSANADIIKEEEIYSAESWGSSSEGSETGATS